MHVYIAVCARVEVRRIPYHSSPYYIEAVFLTEQETHNLGQARPSAMSWNLSVSALPIM